MGTRISDGASAWEKRMKIVVVGLGMVGIAFAEQLISKDKRRKQYQTVLLGEEKYVAYNRVGLTSFFCDHTLLFLMLIGSTSINPRFILAAIGMVSFPRTGIVGISH
jgi:hypothetical protein